MTDSYTFQGGTFDPVEQVDVMPEQEADNARIERSEAEYFDALRKNDQAEVDNVANLFKSLGKFSKSVEGFADELYKKRKEEDMARGAIAAVNSPYNYEDLNMLFNEEEKMKEQDVQLSKIGNEVEQETGRYVLGKKSVICLDGNCILLKKIYFLEKPVLTLNLKELQEVQLM